MAVVAVGDFANPGDVVDMVGQCWLNVWLRAADAVSLV
jgi:hypothetical protein